MEKHKRSIGVTILGWLYIIAGFYAIFNIVTIRSKVTMYEINLYSFPSNYYWVVRISSIAFTVALIILGIGLLKTLNWARLLTLVTEIERFIYNIVFFIVYIHGYMMPYLVRIGKTSSILYAVLIFPVAWLIFILCFLNRPNIKKQFS